MSIFQKSNLKLDFVSPKDFVASKPVMGFEDGMLEMTFVELRQVSFMNLNIFTQC